MPSVVRALIMSAATLAIDGGGTFTKEGSDDNGQDSL
jgi:hypothetical protein